jgi:hypothetical protein
MFWLATQSAALLCNELFRGLQFDPADASIAEAALCCGIRHVLKIDSDFDVYRDAKDKALRPVLQDGWLLPAQSSTLQFNGSTGFALNSAAA